MTAAPSRYSRASKTVSTPNPAPNAVRSARPLASNRQPLYIAGVTYTDEDVVRRARADYFAANGFPPGGGYADRWVEVRLGPLPLYFPNTDSRRRAVRLHDLHHVATGYDTDLTGEAEIGAWELASGCRGYLAAWVLNVAAVGLGLAIAPRRVAAAFARGRRSQNLYGQDYSEALLDDTVGALRRRLGL